MRYIFITYIFLLIALRVVIFQQTNSACEEITGIATPQLLECSRQSDQYDQACIGLHGKVARVGHWWWDLFFIETYTLLAPDGSSCTVFAHNNTPAIGKPVLVFGVFRQFYGGLVTWIGLVEAQRMYGKPPKAPAQTEKTEQASDADMGGPPGEICPPAYPLHENLLSTFSPTVQFSEK